MDEVDRATELSEQLDAIRAARACKRASRPPASHYCVMCGEEIEEGRRKVMPNTRFCIDCKSELER